jgi:hypothetical protein
MNVKRPFFLFLLILSITIAFLNNNGVHSRTPQQPQYVTTTVTSEGGSSSGGDGKIPKPTDPTYNAWCHDLSGITIYTLGSKLNCADNSQAFSMGLMIAVFFTVCIEIAVHILEHNVKNYVTMEIINKVYRELMVSSIIVLDY